MTSLTLATGGAVYRMARRSGWMLVVLVVLTAGPWGPGAVLHAQQAGAGLSPDVIAQIDALEREKEARTPAERKIDSHLLYGLRAQQGVPVANGVNGLASVSNMTATLTDANGRIQIDITTTNAGAGAQLAAAIRAQGGDVVTSAASLAAAAVIGVRGSSVRANVAWNQLLALASRDDVLWIQPKQQYLTLGRQGANGGRGGSLTNTIPKNTGQGSLTSEGDATHRAYLARAVYAVDGTGVKIGVLSNGVDGLAQSQASGDLGAVTVLPGQAGTGAEGTAMLEIVHDPAPGAQLFFATADGGINVFAQNIRDLRAAGCDIIIDDVAYFVETPLQDGQAPAVVSPTNGAAVLQAVIDVTADGALYFSSAGNEGNVTHGTSGTWEGDFVAGASSASPLPTTGALHEFNTGVDFDTLTAIDPGNPTSLWWADPLGASANDYDLFVVNSAGTALVDASTNIQSGTQDPYEEVDPTVTNQRIVVLRKTGSADRFLHISTYRGRLAIGTVGETHGHSHAAQAYSVAATPAVGPFPIPFSASDLVEDFSSDGPRRIFFHDDSTPITPGNFTSSGGVVRQKPDITAADGVSVTGNGGFPTPFFGTSAAAPHAGAIAALIKQAKPLATPAAIHTALVNTAIDIEAGGLDRDSGVGIIMADSALQAIGASAGAALLLSSATAVEHPGDGDGILVGGEGGALTIALQNVGPVSATTVTATLSTSTPWVTITQPAVQVFGTIAAGATVSNALPFLFTMAANAPCGQQIDFTLTLTYGGGVVATTTLAVPVLTGGMIDVNGTLGTPLPPTSVYTTSTGTQTGRLTRNGLISTCAAPKAAPGISSGTPGRTYDAYAFNVCTNLGDTCVQVSLDAVNSINLFTAAYAPSFDPSNTQTNYLADAGLSAATQAYSFKPGSNTTFTVMVHEVNVGSAVGSPYHLRVSGLCSGSCTRNGVPTAAAHNVTVVADASGTANASIDNGSTDPDGDALTFTQSPAGPYPVGVTTVRLTVNDPKGAMSQATGTVTVVPSLLTIAPTSGATSGGTIVTVTGTGFSMTPGATTVMFGATAATNVTCATITSCHATSPAGTGTVDIRVMVASQTTAIVPADQFTFLPAPTVTSIAPASGVGLGGTIVTITGTNFNPAPGGTSVTFGATPATGVTCASATSCQATSPAGAGVVSVRVTANLQTSADTPADDFTYIPAPVITSIAPASGPLVGGTVVTITGTGFATTPGGTTIMFGATAATAITCASATQCQATSPAAASPGSVSVRVTVTGQISADTAADDFAYAVLTYTLAEGATGGFFDEDLLIANPNSVAAPVTLTFFKEDGSIVADSRTLASQSQTMIHVDALPGLEATSAAVQVTSTNGLPLAVERSMFWDATYYAGHSAGAVDAPSTQSYFAEGSQGFFDTYILVVNPATSSTDVTITFLVEGGAPVMRTYTVGADARLTVWAGSIPELVNRSFGIAILATQPVIAERSMYFGSTPGRVWSGGHASGGSPLGSQWYFAEGATGGFFDTFLLIGNPQGTDAHVQVQYLLDNGTVITVPRTVAANSRLTINVETESDPRLANASFSTFISSDVPIVAERSMYWPGVIVPWGEAHNSAGVTQPSASWALAEGRVGGSHNFHTYILLGNPQSTAAQVTVTYLRENGAAPIVKTYTVPATTRFNIDVNTVVPELADEGFGARIDITNGVPIIVERSMYWDANGHFWSGGSNATGVPVP